MAGEWDLNDDLKIDALFPPEMPPVGSREGLEAVTGAARRSLLKVAALFWRQYLSEIELRGLGLYAYPGHTDVAEMARDAHVLLKWVNPERLAQGGDTQFVHHEERGTNWVIARDEHFNAFIEMLSKVRTSLGWTSSPTWDVVGTIEEAVTIGEGSKKDQQTKAVLLGLKAVWVPGRVCGFYHPEQGWRLPGVPKTISSCSTPYGSRTSRSHFRDVHSTR